MRRSETNITLQAPAVGPGPVAAGPGALRPSQRSDDSSAPRQVGRYRILFELARGGTACVYVACLRGPSGFHHVLALKRPTQASEAGEAGALFAEARLTAQIAHHGLLDDASRYVIALSFLPATMSSSHE